MVKQYGKLDRELGRVHNLLLTVEGGPEEFIERLVEDEKRLCDEMRNISISDHSQVEEYRSAMGWKPCFNCRSRREED